MERLNTNSDSSVTNGAVLRMCIHSFVCAQIALMYRFKVQRVQSAECKGLVWVLCGLEIVAFK